MKIVKVSIIFLLALICMTDGEEYAGANKREGELSAAFVRGGDLWLKEGNKEKKLDSGPWIRHPRWSADGKWLAYTKGEADQELWVLEVRSTEAHQVSLEGGNSFAWAPNDRRLAYQIEDRLSYVDVLDPDKPLGTANGIGNFSWLPSGEGFFVSSQSKQLPDGWTPISLYQIPLEALGDPSQYITVHVLPKPSDDFFAVDTSIFKWSADGRWIAFLAKPTASLSADSNILCVVTSDGVVFRTLDEMVNHEQWFEWAEKGDRLAYIAGIGREATSNKQLKVLAVTRERGAAYTPKGYVDQAFAWQDMQYIVVSRAVEAKREEPHTAPSYPFLVSIELASGKQMQITMPSKDSGAFQPVKLSAKLAWVKYGQGQAEASAIVAEADGRRPVEWIKGMDAADAYYGQWDWGAVLSFYERGRR